MAGILKRCGTNDYRLKRCGANNYNLKRCPSCEGCDNPDPLTIVISGVTGCTCVSGNVTYIGSIVSGINGAFTMPSGFCGWQYNNCGVVKYTYIGPSNTCWRECSVDLFATVTTGPAFAVWMTFGSYTAYGGTCYLLYCSTTNGQAPFTGQVAMPNCWGPPLVVPNAREACCYPPQSWPTVLWSGGVAEAIV